MRGYELMYILDPTMDEGATQSLIGQIEDFMAKQGVTVEKTDPWGKRRLAYRIGKHLEGFYVLSQLQAAPGSVAEVERRLRVTDGVLRFLTVRVDEEQEKIERQRARKAAHEAARQQRRGERKPAPAIEGEVAEEARGASAPPDATSAEASTAEKGAGVEPFEGSEDEKEETGPIGEGS